MMVALKKIDLVQVKEEEMENQLAEEMKLQLFMNHPNVLKMYGYFKEGTELYMILEYADGKSLFSKMNKQVKMLLFSWKKRLLLFIQGKCFKL